MRASESVGCARKAESTLRVQRRPELRQQLVVGPSRVGLVRRHRIAARPKEPRRPPRPDEARERFVEHRLPRRVERVVRQLVDDGVRQVDRVGAQRRGEQRIVEPAERAERRRRSQIDVEPFRRQVVFAPCAPPRNRRSPCTERGRRSGTTMCTARAGPRYAPESTSTSVSRSSCV